MATHLIAAGSVSELHRLLALEIASEPQHKNLWFCVKEIAGDSAGSRYCTDISLALAASEDDFSRDHSPVAIGWQCCYALIRASLNSLTHVLSEDLVLASIASGFWSLDRDLAYVDRLPPTERIRILADLLGMLESPDCEKAARETLLILNQIEEGPPQLPGQVRLPGKVGERAFVSAVKCCREIQDWMIHDLDVLNLERQSIDYQRMMRDEWTDTMIKRWGWLGELADTPARFQVLQSELDFPQRIARAGLQAQAYFEMAPALGALAPHCTNELLTEVRDKIEAMEDGYERSFALADVMADLPGRDEFKVETLRLAMDVVDQIVSP